MTPAVKTLIILAFIAIFFITEAIPLAITAIGGGIACAMVGVLPMSRIFVGMANSTVVLFGGMFIVGAAMFHTGLAQAVGEAVVRKAGSSETALMFGVMLVATILSSVLSNTGTCACLMPVVLSICAVAKIPASRQLMPLAFACSWGGSITLVGTPPNLIVNAALDAAKLPKFGFFEFAWIGIPISIAGIIYMLTLGKHLLPNVELSADQDIEQEIEATVKDKKKQWISGLTLLVVVIFMALDFKWMPLHVAAVIGAMVCVLTGCLTEKQAYASVDWVTMFLLGMMMAVAEALEKSGAGKLIADAAVGLMGGDPSPYVVMAVLFLIASVLTQFMSNTAATALFAPIGISIAQSLGASPQAVLMAIGISAASAYATPVGTPPNTLILGPGGYKFMDYVKPGIGMILICFVLSLAILPIVFPFFPGK